MWHPVDIKGHRPSFLVVSGYMTPCQHYWSGCDTTHGNCNMTVCVLSGRQQNVEGTGESGSGFGTVVLYRCTTLNVLGSIPASYCSTLLAIERRSNVFDRVPNFLRPTTWPYHIILLFISANDQSDTTPETTTPVTTSHDTTTPETTTPVTTSHDTTTPETTTPETTSHETTTPESTSPEATTPVTTTPGTTTPKTTSPETTTPVTTTPETNTH